MADDYQKQYSERSFLKKARGAALAAGEKLLTKALMMYFAARDPGTPAWARTVIYSALGYFILPLDAIPDLLGPVGYADDLGAVLAAFATVAVYVKPEHSSKAAEKIDALLRKK